VKSKLACVKIELDLFVPQLFSGRNPNLKCRPQKRGDYLAQTLGEVSALECFPSTQTAGGKNGKED